MPKKLTLLLLVFALLSASVLAYECTDKCKISGNSCLCPSAPIWVSQDSPLTVLVAKTQHVVKVIDVTESEDSCGISVDGVIKWLPKGKTFEVNGLNVVVFDMKTVHSQVQDNDVCRLFIAGTIILPVEKIYVETNDSTAVMMVRENKTSVSNISEENNSAEIPAPVQERPKSILQMIIEFLTSLFKK